MNNRLNNSNDGTESSSNKITPTLSSPANNSLQQSYYIAALDKYLGLRGLVSPVKDTRGARIFNYDFWHVESETLIKVFKRIDELEIIRYHNHADVVQTRFLVDASEVTGEVCEGCGEVCISNVPPEYMEAAANLNAYIYIDGKLWEYIDVNDEYVWEPVVPVERNYIMGAILTLP